MLCVLSIAIVIVIVIVPMQGKMHRAAIWTTA